MKFKLAVLVLLGALAGGTTLWAAHEKQVVCQDGPCPVCIFGGECCGSCR